MEAGHSHSEEEEPVEAHAEGSAHAGEEEEHGGMDLHFWLDLERLSHAAEAVALIALVREPVLMILDDA